jgi:hypothetical protein
MVRMLPRRSWFRFSLRGLFVVLSVFAVWLGWELAFIRQRQSIRKEFEARGAYFRVAAEYLAEIKSVRLMPGTVPISAETEEHFKETIPIWRRWLGDKTFDHVGLPHDATEEDFARVRTLYRESEVVRQLSPDKIPMFKVGI